MLANFESGRRPTVSIPELLVFARALEVPAVQLVFPIGQADTVDALPDSPATTWEALKWFTGEANRLPSDLEKTQDVEAVQLYREHERLVLDWWTNRQEMDQIIATRGRTDLREFRREADPDAIDDRLLELKVDRMRDLSDAIAAVRQEMRNLGLTPPQLGAEAAYVEPESFSEGTTLDELARTVAYTERISLAEAVRKVYRRAGEAPPENSRGEGTQ
ncbi:hypothetical protein OHA11_21530 [Streptomyces sp. NBC_00878]|nr:hypothetical protein [Streptomyces sp. NBC_00878]